MSTEHLVGDIGLILNALMGSADQPRQEAESHLRRLTVQSPGDVLLVLAQIGALGVGGFQLDERLLSIILLRRMTFTPIPGLFLNDQSHSASSPFDVIAERTKTRIETVLCTGLKDEVNVRMRKGLGNCVGSWASESSSRQRPCLAIPPVLLELTTSPHPFHRFTPFQLLHTTPTLLIDSVSEPVPVQQLASLLVGGLNDSSFDVRVEALRALCSLLQEGVTGKEREEVGAALLDQAFETLPKLPLELLSHGLLPFIVLASLYPNIFVPSLNTILPFLLSLMSPPTTPSAPMPNHSFSSYPPSSIASFDDWEKVANPATEIILLLCEFRKAQVMAWENGRALREMVGLLMARLVAGLAGQGEECQEWLEETDLDEEDEEYPAYPEECLDRLAETSDGQNLLPAVSDQVQALVKLPDWRCRYTALVSIASVAEGCVEEVKPRLSDVLGLISPLAKDPHPRVRYGFLQCLGQLCSDLEGQVQATYPRQVLDICVEMLEDSAARVRTHAAACLCNFLNQSEISLFANHVDILLAKLKANYEHGPLYIREQVFPTISTMASIAASAFLPWYRDTMGFVMGALSQPVEPETRKLQGKAVECASMIGLAVGKATFAPDAVRLAEVIIGIQNDCTASDDPRSLYLMDAWANLARSLGRDFGPFLPHVIPPLLKAASYKPSESVEPAFSMTGEESPTDPLLATTNHSALEEKSLAFDNLTVYAHTMHEGFEQWLAPSMVIALEALTFTYAEDVRETAAFLVPALLQVAKEARSWQNEPYQLEHVFKTVINAMAKEVDFGFLALLYKSFNDSLRVIATPLPPQLFSHFSRVTFAHLNDLHGRREDRQAQEGYMDEGDRELYLEEQEDEDTCLQHMAKTLDRLLEVGGMDNQQREEVIGLLKRCAMVSEEGLQG